MTIIKRIMFLHTGAYVTFNAEGSQIPKEQGNAFIRTLQSKLNRGVITKKTQVMMPGWKDGTVNDFIKSKRLYLRGRR